MADPKPLRTPLGDLERRVVQLETAGGGGGGGGYDGRMEERVGHLETDMKDVRERLTKIETKLDFMASKSDLAEAKFQIILWVVSAVFLAQLLPGILRKFGM